MVKGNSKQVIVLHSPDPKLFEQAIFILRDDAVGREGITEAKLMQEANRLLETDRKSKGFVTGLLWAFAGAALTGVLWLLSSLI